MAPKCVAHISSNDGWVIGWRTTGCAGRTDRLKKSREVVSAARITLAGAVEVEEPRLSRAHGHREFAVRVVKVVAIAKAHGRD